MAASDNKNMNYYRMGNKQNDTSEEVLPTGIFQNVLLVDASKALTLLFISSRKIKFLTMMVIPCR